MKKSKLKKQNESMRTDIFNLIFNPDKPEGIETKLFWHAVLYDPNVILNENKSQKSETVRVPFKSLSNKSIYELMQKPYVPKYVIIDGFRTDNTSCLPWLATFLIPPDEFPNSGYNTHIVKVGVTLRQSFIDDFKANKQ
jgi:hypothetical protein